MASYDTLANLKKAAQLPSSADPNLDPVLTQMLSDATRAIDDYCKRSFASVQETRSFYATRSSILWVDDLLEVTSVTAGTTALVEGTDYELRPLNLNDRTPHYDQLVRMSGSVEIDWTWQPPRVKVAIVGTWGYASTVPPTIVQ